MSLGKLLQSERASERIVGAMIDLVEQYLATRDLPPDSLVKQSVRGAAIAVMRRELEGIDTTSTRAMLDLWNRSQCLDELCEMLLVDPIRQMPHLDTRRLEGADLRKSIRAALEHAGFDVGRRFPR